MTNVDKTILHREISRVHIFPTVALFLGYANDQRPGGRHLRHGTFGGRRVDFEITSKSELEHVIFRAFVYIHIDFQVLMGLKCLPYI